MCVLVIIAIMAILYIAFLPIRICGDSMYPTLKDGEIYLTVRTNSLTKYTVGKIYVYKSSTDNKYVIKRLAKINTFGHLFFEGDNKSVSYDSRHYGYIPKDRVKFRVLTGKEF